MGQLGFFDVRRRYESLDAKKRSIGFRRDDVPWESFRSKLIAAADHRLASHERCDAQEFGGTQALGRIGDLQGSGGTGALQSFGRSGGISASRSPLVHVVSRPWSRRRGPDAKTLRGARTPACCTESGRAIGNAPLLS